MPRTMQYTDVRGRPQTLTWVQWVYLDTARKYKFERGWGGLDSTRTIRILNERGLLDYRDGFGSRPWQVTGLTRFGVEILERWHAREAVT